ncbi:hypothetical protein Q4485_12550 [Granulosicoccaceae sp. 1_MG-2023]|nr:hypothetical protein [Granulosicoccaceae sp. 1_MG-2023]
MTLFLGALVACGSSDGGGDGGSSGGISGDGAGDGGSSGGISGDGDSGGSGGTLSASRYGHLSLTEFEDESGASMVSASASFLRYSEPLAWRHDFLEDLIGECLVEDGASDNSGLPDIGPDDEEDTVSLDAGEPLTIKRDGELYLTLDKLSFAGIITYNSDIVPGPMPSALTLNVPGGDFVAVDDLSVAGVDSMSVTAPAAGEAVRYDTVFSWQAGSDGDAVVLIVASSGDSSVTCYTDDDGSFSFPQDVQNELGTAFLSDSFDIQRVKAELFYLDDDTALAVWSMSMR